MRLVRPDLTDTPEWFLKHDLSTHPRFAHSTDKTETMQLRSVEQIKNRFYKRSMLGNSEYLTNYEEEQRQRLAEESI